MSLTITITDGIVEKRIKPSDLKLCIEARLLDLRDSIATDANYVPEGDLRYREIRLYKSLARLHNVKLNVEV